MIGVYIFYASLWKAWAQSMTPLAPKPPGLEEGARREQPHPSTYFPHLARGPDYPKSKQRKRKQ
jgi:hypothetical protein